MPDNEEEMEQSDQEAAETTSEETSETVAEVTEPTGEEASETTEAPAEDAAPARRTHRDFQPATKRGKAGMVCGVCGNFAAANQSLTNFAKKPAMRTRRKRQPSSVPITSE